MRRSFPLALWPILSLFLAACTPPAVSVDDLARIEDRRDVRSEMLGRALDAAEPGRRARAAVAMGRIQSMDFADGLARATRDGVPEVRAAALFALGQLGLARGARPAPVALEAARAAATDDDPAIRALAVEALGKLADLADQARLRTALADASPEVRAEAAHALFRLRFVPTWRGAAEAPPDLEEASTVALIDALEDASAPVRRLAAHAFSRYGEPRALTGLDGALDDTDEWTRLFAARGLGRAGDEGAIEPLLARLDDGSARVRTEVVAAVGRLGGGDRLPPSVFADPSFHVRTAAVAADGPGAAAPIPIASRLDDPSPTVVAAALAALARRAEAGQPLPQAALERLDDPRWPVRVAAVRALSTLGERALPALARASEDPAAAVRLAAFETRFAVAPRIETLEPGLASDDLAMRGTALALLDELRPDDARERLERLYDASSGEAWVEIREEIVDRLGADPDALPRLRAIAGSDAAGSVRERARQALEQLGEPVPEATVEPGPESPWLGVTFEADPVVEFETSKGTLVIRCLPEAAPVHVASFVERVEAGFYDGLAWHRVVPNFVVQGGDPRGDGWGGAGILLRDEISRERYERGTVGMPKAGKDTGGGQLFITHVPTPHLDGNYTVFGRVVGGDEVIDRLEVGDTIVRATVRRD